METFKTKVPDESKLFLQVNFDHKYLSRTWVQKEKTGTWKKTTIRDSNPGDGNITFFEVGKTNEYKDLNRIIIITYLDLQKIKDKEEFIKKMKVKYNLVEDDDKPGNFYESQIYTCIADEMELPDENILVVTKIIEIR